MKHKLLAITLALAMTLGLAACGGRESSAAEDNSSLAGAFDAAVGAVSEKTADAAAESTPSAASEVTAPTAPEQSAATETEAPQDDASADMSRNLSDLSQGDALAANEPPATEAAPDDDTSPADVQITEVTEEMLAQYTAYSEVDVATDNYKIRVLLTTDRTVYDLRLFRLVWDDAAQGMVEAPDSVVFQKEELTPEMPQVIFLSIPGTMPTTGLEFTDADGTIRTYHIIMSGYDGSIQLEEAGLVG